MSSSDNDIAIVGMSLRVPGANDPRAFWDNLASGVESIERYTREQLLEAGERRDRLERPNYVPAGAPLDAMADFDAEFFGFSPKEAAILDPQHRHFMECAWEALEDAGHPPEAMAGPIGVFAGCGMGSYFYFNLCTRPELVDGVGMFLLRHTGNDKDFLATRVSYLFDLKGPSLNIQTACSTSLVAVHQASQSLLSGECDLALAGGVTIELPHRRGYLYQQREILSPDGHCYAFDHRAQGTVFGSGVGVVALRRLSDALEDGDVIYAVLKGSAVNNDGARKAGYLAPSVDGQAAAIEEALAIAGVEADTVGYVECHGTGTYLGDPIEVAALTQAFGQTTQRKGFCKLGSVKSNIGHLDTAAGVVGLIKASLAVAHGQVPPSLNFEKPNPTIDFASSPFAVANGLTPFPESSAPRRAGVNSLGVGGTNAHAVVEQAPARAESPPARGPQLLVLSARTSRGLDAQAARLAAHLKQTRELNLADVSFTLLRGRRAFAKRRVLAASTAEEAIDLLENSDPRSVHNHSQLTDRPSVVFMFPGGGAQYVNMARGLYDAYPELRNWVDRGLTHLRSLVDFDPRELLLPKMPEEGVGKALRQPSRQLPLLFIVEYALAQLWISLGVKPAALVGHSVGENTAAAVAGVLTFEEGIGLTLKRGQLFDGIQPGGMLSVPLARATLEPQLPSELDLACVNAPELCVVSGPREALSAFQEKLRNDDVEARSIPIDIAAHSRLLEPMLAEFENHLRGIKLRPPQIPIVSNRTAEPLTPSQATDPRYWVEHLRRTVHFAEGIDALAEVPGRVFLEVGPGRVLSSLARQSRGVTAQTVVPSLRHPDENCGDQRFLVTVMGRLWALGVELSDQALFGEAKRRRVSLPSYAFQRQSYWIEPGQPEAGASRSALPMKQEDLDQWFFEHAWQKRDRAAADKSEAGRYLIFLDDTGVGSRLAAALREHGASVTVVGEGDAFYRVSDHEYRVSYEQGLSGYEALLGDLVACGNVPDQVVHLGLLTDRERFRPGSSFFHTNQERGFFSLMLLGQALIGLDYPTPLHLTVVTSGMQRVANEALPYPEKATVLGPALVIPREMPGVTCRVVDVELARSAGPLVDRLRATKLARRAELIASQSSIGTAPLQPKEASAQLLAELRTGGANEQVALRRAGRYVRELTRRSPPETESSGRTFRQKGTYLITGGLGGIGLSLARHLAKKYQANLVLVGRTKLPARERYQTYMDTRPHDSLTKKLQAIQNLEARGARVLPVSADVTHIEQMQEVVQLAQEQFGAINGVIHAAGTLSDHPIAGKNQADVDAVMAPKVYGTLVLRKVLEERPLDFFLLFSSTSAVLAPPGQVDYVAANAYLNAVASQSQGLGAPPRTLSVGWGMWRDVGMAASMAQGEVAGPERAAQSVEHPLLRECRTIADGRLELKGWWTADTQWVVAEHRTTDKIAVLPGTGYLELLRAVAEHVAPGQSVSIEDLLFLNPLQVDDTETTEVCVHLKPDDQGYEVSISSRRMGAPGPAIANAEAQLSLVRLPTPEAALDIRSVEQNCNGRLVPDNPQGIATGQEAHLTFGPRWRVLRSLAVGEKEALARLALPEAFESDLASYGLHPSLMDLATGFAMDLIPDYTGEALWVPVSYRSVKVHRRLPARIVSWARLNQDIDVAQGLASFDITIADSEGKVCVEVEHFTIKRLADAAFAPGPDSRRPTQGQPLEAVNNSEEVDLSPEQIVFQHTLAQGIAEQEGISCLERLLASSLSGEVLVSSLDLREVASQLEERSKAPSSAATKFSRPQLDSDYAAPRNDVERTLAEFWEELLGMDRVGIFDNFFELGGHSLIALRLFAKIKKTYRIDYPMSVLFEAPTIEKCASLLQSSLGNTGYDRAPNSDARNTRYRHLVRMDSGNAEAQRPFFLVAGMFGNVLNLRHVAGLVGSDRPCYGLQARGLYGDTPPHESFEEMAQDYLEEIRTVQPSGPYLLGGFSGGGIAAYEMARQLLEAGEAVSLLAMLDTPAPEPATPLSLSDRVEIRVEDLKREKLGLVASWVQGKLDHYLQQRTKADQLVAQTRGESHDFHSQRIEAAFYRALEKYQLGVVPLEVVLFRPTATVAYALRDGRKLGPQRDLLRDDNGWGRWTQHVRVIEVPGDHDSMVLEPNVRVLAEELRSCIERHDADVVSLASVRASQKRAAAESQPSGSSRSLSGSQ